jgi:hypothetical protein
MIIAVYVFFTLVAEQSRANPKSPVSVSSMKTRHLCVCHFRNILILVNPRFSVVDAEREPYCVSCFSHIRSRTKFDQPRCPVKGTGNKNWRLFLTSVVTKQCLAVFRAPLLYVAITIKCLCCLRPHAVKGAHFMHWIAVRLRQLRHWVLVNLRKYH